MRSYVRAFFVSALVTFCLAGVINLVVDPYGVYRWVDIEGFNQRKPTAGPHGRLSKPYRLPQVRPRTLLLGNSRVEAGLDPASPRWPAQLRPVFNMALPATTLSTSLEHLRQALAMDTPPGVVVLGLDFIGFVYDADASPKAQPREETGDRPRIGARFAHAFDPLKEHLTMLFSLNTLTDSLQTVFRQRLSDQADLTELGFNPLEEFRRFVRNDGQHIMFRQVNLTYFASYLRLKPVLYVGGSASSPEFEHLREIIGLTRAARIRLLLFIHPYHAHILESYRIAGMWPLFEEWKRALVQIVEEAHLPDGSAGTVELWDFSGYNDYTGERVPTAAEKGRAMRWYWEAGHYKRELGDLLLATMLGSTGNPGHSVPGVRLTASGVEDRIAATREARTAYVSGRAEEMAALEAMARATRERIAARAR